MRRATIAAVLLMAASAVGAGPHRTTPPFLDGPSADQCRVCHREIWEEWRTSHHALSATNRNFQVALQNWVREEGHGPEECLDCHGPRPVLVTGLTTKPIARAGLIGEGVNCVVCHMDGEGRIHGPYEVDAPHPSVANRTLRTVKACVSCHGQTRAPCGKQVQSWELSGLKTKAVCQSCHMPARQGPLVQWINFSVPTRRVTSHAFPGVHDARFLAGALSVEMEVADERVVIHIRNTGAAHSVPASPWRKLIAQVEVTDQLGRTVMRKRDGYFHSRHNAIVPDAPATITFTRHAPMARVKVTLRFRYHPGQTDDEAAVILEREFGL